MRARLIILLLVILAVAGFAALNWAEFMRSTPLNFGLFVMDAPLGAILLGLLVLGLVAYLVASGVTHSHMRQTEHRYARDLQAQRELADKAEASRYTELRQYLDSHFREGDQRGAVVSAEFERSMQQGQRDLRAQLDQMNQTLARRLSDLEERMEARMERFSPAAVDATARPVDRPEDVNLPPRDRLKV